jgi:diadenosine tetraphosphate (Ap4A) HIT family hydrolase
MKPPDHMNVESLGNVMPHLHWHIFPRCKNDGRWGAPDLTQVPLGFARLVGSAVSGSSGQKCLG